MCLRKMEADYDFDYIQLAGMEEEESQARLHSDSYLSMNVSVSVLDGEEENQKSPGGKKPSNSDLEDDKEKYRLSCIPEVRESEEFSR